MNRDKKICKWFLVIGFVYLTMCPHAYELTDGLFKYKAVSSRIQNLDNKQQRACDSSMPAAMTAFAPGGPMAIPDTGLLYRFFESPRIEPGTSPLFSVKLRL